MNNIAELEPKEVWSNFAKICNIPHPSGYEEGVIEFLEDFAKNNGLSCYKEPCGNIILEREAAKGFEKAPVVILQAHVDMVPVAGATKIHDFLKDKIETIIHEDIGYVTANDTTLGADDGIGASIALALISDKSLICGKLRAIFTVEEETTMKGANNLDAKWLDANYLINLDSEETDFLYVSCAGSADINITKELAFTSVDDTYTGLSVRICELSGGHSGADIHLGHANAITLLAEILNYANLKYDLMFESATAGQVRNSIPNSACFKLVCKKELREELIQTLNDGFNLFYKDIYTKTDPNALIVIEDCEIKKGASLQGVLSLINAIPVGPFRMSDIDRSVVETSNNLGLLSTEDNKLHLKLMARSLKDTGLKSICNRIESICKAIPTVKAEVANFHPCWSSPDSNDLIALTKQNFKELCGRDMKVTAIHAGLECAMFSQKNKDLQLMSIGPTVEFAHTAKERVHIESVALIYKTLSKTIAMLH